VLQTQTLSAPTVKQRLAAIRHLFDWLVIGQVVPHNPAASVRGPSHTARQGKTPVLDTVEARQLLDSIDVSTPIGLRDRALIGLMVFSFARVGAALAMRVEDVYVQNKRLWVRLREKGVPSVRTPGQRGDEYIELQVVVPKPVDERVKELLRELEKIAPEDPRKDLFEKAKA